MSATGQNPNPDGNAGTGEGATTEVTGQNNDGTLLGKTGEETIDYATLFSPDEVKAKQESLAAAKAEEERRAALTEEERKAEDDKKAEEAAKNGDAPETYEAWKLAEGVTLDAGLSDKFIPLAKELNLSQAKAQSVIDFYAKEVMPEMQRRQQEQWDNIKTEWHKAAMEDKVFGGEKHEQYMHAAGRVMDAFEKEHPEYGKNLRAEMNEYGYGNSPNMVAFVKWMGQKMGEDPNLPGKTTGASEKSPYFKYKTT